MPSHIVDGTVLVFVGVALIAFGRPLVASCFGLMGLLLYIR
jgi:hypothetical protein